MLIKAENQKSKKNRKPKVGVVVGSGGIKAISSIPLFEFLEEAEIDVDLLIGSSGGSIFAGWWATCESASLLRNTVHKLWTRELFAKIDYRTLLSIAGMPFCRFDKTRGLLKPDNVHKGYYGLYGDQMIEDLHTRMILQSTDLDSGEQVLLESGLLRDAVYASSALFPILPPIYLNGRWLMDGAVSAPLPILKAVKEDMDVIIAITNEERTTEESSNFIDALRRTISYQTTWLLRNQVALSVDLHHHEIILINVVFDKNIGLRSINKIPEILEAGQKAVDKQRDEIIEAIENFSK